MVETNESLLERLRAGDAHDAWREFYDLYAAAILRFARKLGMNDAEAQDVLQEVLVSLLHLLPGFVYDRRKGRFRNFLLTIVRHRAKSVERRRLRMAELYPDAGSGRTAAVGADANRDEKEDDIRWRECPIEEALVRLRADRRLGADTWAVFEACVIAREPVAAVARRFRLTENAVYQIKARLLRRLRTDIEFRVRESGSGD